MRRVLLDQALEQKFDRNGFVVVDLLSPAELVEVKQMLSRLDKRAAEAGREIESEYKLSFFSDSPEYRMDVFREVAEYFQPKVNRWLKSYVPLIINIFDKEPGKGEVPVHQNWTFVDESKFTSVSVWIPMVDAGRENGGLEVVPGSHRVLTPFRSPSIPWVFQDLFDQLREKYLEPLDVKAGQAAIIDDGILHWSSENKTTINRTAIQLIMRPEEAPALHYFRNVINPDELEVYEVNSEFFTKFNMHEPPRDVPKVGVVSFQYHNLSEAEMLEKISVNNPAILQKR